MIDKTKIRSFFIYFIYIISSIFFILYFLFSAPLCSAATVIPVLTSNNSQPPWVVSASSIYSSQYDVWNAFDNNSSTLWDAGANTTSGFFAIDTGLQFQISSFDIFVGNYLLYGPKDFVLQGSNNNTDWTDIQTYTNSTYTTGPPTTFVVTGSPFYRAYRLNISSTGGGTELIIIDFSLSGNFQSSGGSNNNDLLTENFLMGLAGIVSAGLLVWSVQAAFLS